MKYFASNQSSPRCDSFLGQALISPGKPILFAELPDGTLYFGLPGNPIAVAAGMRFFVVEIIRELLGLRPEKPTKAKLAVDVYEKLGFKSFLKAQASVDESGQLMCQLLKKQDSYHAQSFAPANCWLILAKEGEYIKQGEWVGVLPRTPNQWLS